MRRKHAMRFGAECLDTGVQFRLWAPKAKRVDLLLPPNDRAHRMSTLDEGWFELVMPDVVAGSDYLFQIDGEAKIPDPASRFQPQDVHGPSQIVDPSSFEWGDDSWKGLPWEQAAIYELHVGTFTPEGTFSAVIPKLDHLASLGITAIELMPVSDFPGNRGWGYDGVLPFSPDSCYGRPEDLKKLVQAAHAKGLMVFLDVVYNHFGPDGNYLMTYSPEFFTGRHCTPWGDAINFDGPGSKVVREYFIHNALYWLEEFHFDGLRLDAVHTILDDSEVHFLDELAEQVRTFFGEKRQVHLVLENGDNIVKFMERKNKSVLRSFNAQWNDDIHHTLQVLITGETDGYYSDYAKHSLQTLGRCLTEGFAYQGNFSAYENGPRGEISKNLPASAFVSFLQNHDQIGNRAFGDRLVTYSSPEALKAAITILLLAPSPPLIFMGEEFAATTPFLFFCDFSGDLAKAVTSGRRKEFERFTRFGSEEIPDPNSEQTFLNSKLNWHEAKQPGNLEWMSYYRELLSLRKKLITPFSAAATGNDSAFRLVGEKTLAVQWQLNAGGTLHLVANLTDQLAPGFLPGGDFIFATSSQVVDDLSKGQLPAWSVAWFLQS